MEVKLSHRHHRLPLSQFFLYKPSSSNSSICKSQKRTSLPKPPKSLPEVPTLRLELRPAVTTPTCVPLRAKTNTGYFLVLGTLLAFCIGFVISSVHGKAARDSVHEDFSKPKSKSRWKHVLRDTRDPDSSVSETADSYAEQIASEEQDHYPSADAYEEYRKLERDYQRFLYECGTRGGKLENL